MQTKILTPEDIKGLIKNATTTELEMIFIPKIMERQTWDEIAQNDTHEKNGVGLNGVDGEFITSIFKAIKAGCHLSKKQTTSVRKILQKYAKQYVEMAEEGRTKMAGVKNANRI